MPANLNMEDNDGIRYDFLTSLGDDALLNKGILFPVTMRVEVPSSLVEFHDFWEVRKHRTGVDYFECPYVHTRPSYEGLEDADQERYAEEMKSPVFDIDELDKDSEDPRMQLVIELFLYLYGRVSAPEVAEKLSYQEVVAMGRDITNWDKGEWPHFILPMSRENEFPVSKFYTKGPKVWSPNTTPNIDYPRYPPPLARALNSEVAPVFEEVVRKDISEVKRNDNVTLDLTPEELIGYLYTHLDGSGARELSLSERMNGLEFRSCKAAVSAVSGLTDVNVNEHFLAGLRGSRRSDLMATLLTSCEVRAYLQEQNVDFVNILKELEDKMAVLGEYYQIQRDYVGRWIDGFYKEDLGSIEDLVDVFYLDLESSDYNLDGILDEDRVLYLFSRRLENIMEKEISCQDRESKVKELIREQLTGDNSFLNLVLSYYSNDPQQSELVSEISEALSFRTLLDPLIEAELDEDIINNIVGRLVSKASIPRESLTYDDNDNIAITTVFGTPSFSCRIRDIGNIILETCWAYGMQSELDNILDIEFEVQMEDFEGKDTLQRVLDLTINYMREKYGDTSPYVKNTLTLLGNFDETLDSLENSQPEWLVQIVREFNLYSKVFLLEDLPNELFATRRSVLNEYVKSIWRETYVAEGLEFGKHYESDEVRGTDSLGRYRAQVILNQVIKFLNRRHHLSSQDIRDLSGISRESQVGVDGVRYDQPTLRDLGVFEVISNATISSKWQTHGKIRALQLYQFLLDTPYACSDFYEAVTTGFLPDELQGLLDFLEGENIRGISMFRQAEDMYKGMAALVALDPDEPLTRVLDVDGNWSRFSRGFYMRLAGLLAQNGIYPKNLPNYCGAHEEFMDLLMRLVLVKTIRTMTVKVKKAGYSLTEVISGEGGTFEVNNLYPLSLVLDDIRARSLSFREPISVVPNSIFLNPDEIVVFLGAGGCGKTTFLKELAQVAIFGQVGLPVVADSVFMPEVEMALLAINADRDTMGGSKFRNMAERIILFMDRAYSVCQEETSRHLVVMMDELFRGTDDINAVALIYTVLKAMSENPRTFVATSTHFSLLAEVMAEGVLSGGFIDFRSFSSGHSMVKGERPSDFFLVLEKMGFSANFVQTFLDILHNKEFNIAESIDLSEIGRAGTKLSYLSAAIDLGLLKSEQGIIRGWSTWLDCVTFYHTGISAQEQMNLITNWAFEVEEYYNRRTTLNIRQSTYKKLGSENDRVLSMITNFVGGLNDSDLNSPWGEKEEKIARFRKKIVNAISIVEESRESSGIVGLLAKHMSLAVEGIEVGEISSRRELLNEMSQRLRTPESFDILFNDFISSLDMSDNKLKEILLDSHSGEDFIRNLYGRLSSEALGSEEFYPSTVVEHIIRNLSSFDFEDLDELKSAVLGGLDSSIFYDAMQEFSYYASVRHYAESYGEWSYAEIGGDRTIISQGYTPQLYRYCQRDGSRLVLNDLDCDLNTLGVLSGDNFAGKTKFLKMILTNVLVGNTLGITFAKSAVIPEVADVLVMLSGNSTKDGLSSSMHEAREIGEILSRAQELRDRGEQVLVGLDEPGATIASDEGSVLAALVMKYLRDMGHGIFITTHYHQLYSMLHELFPDIDIKSYGFIFEESSDEDLDQRYLAIPDLRPGSSRGIERLLWLIDQMEGELENYDLIKSLFEGALVYRQRVQEFVASDEV